MRFRVERARAQTVAASSDGSRPSRAAPEPCARPRARLSGVASAAFVVLSALAPLGGCTGHDDASEAAENEADPERPTSAKVEPPPGFERADVAGVAPTTRGHAVVLSSGDRALPIFVGQTEGLSIELRLMGGRFHRPLTHDLVDAMLADLGGRIESVRIEREQNAIYYSVVVLLHDGKRSELDARTSDAIALALGNGVPIFIARALLEQAGVRIDDLDDEGAPEPSAPSRVPPAPGTVPL